MRILFFVSSMHSGGAERVAATLSGAWARRGDSVTLVPTFTGKGSCFYELNPGVRLIWLADRMGWLGRKTFPAVAKWFAIRRLIRERKPDIIVSFLTNVNVMVLMATRGMSTPVLVCERTSPAHSQAAQNWLARMRRKTYPRATAVVLQSQQAAESFRPMVPGVRELLWVPNPLPADLLNVNVQEFATTGPRRSLVAMGRLQPVKQFDVLIRVFASLANDFPDWDLTIWGEGPERPMLEQQINHAGLQDRITLPGRTQTPWQALAAADLFVMTSKVEGFPNVLLEAMALDRACVAFDCPDGPKEITEDGRYAFLAPLGDDRSLSSSLSQLMADSTLRQAMGRRAGAHVRERYSLERIVQQWDTIFDRACAGNNDGGLS
jgi:GalNAc-alpha-(1->4)-GalNAc-alpha-(1->3)-diNAcBac-PP-undecaprenol alpha-1,4-N-acetyl-D-galactosaminyltransferase